MNELLEHHQRYSLSHTPIFYHSKTIKLLQPQHLHDFPIQEYILMAFSGKNDYDTIFMFIML